MRTQLSRKMKGWTEDNSAVASIVAKLWLSISLLQFVLPIVGACPHACICKWKGGKQSVSLNSLNFLQELVIVSMGRNKIHVLKRPSYSWHICLIV